MILVWWGASSQGPFDRQPGAMGGTAKTPSVELLRSPKSQLAERERERVHYWYILGQSHVQPSNLGDSPISHVLLASIELGPCRLLVLKRYPLSRFSVNWGLSFWKSLQVVIYGNVWDSQEQREGPFCTAGSSLFRGFHQAIPVPAALVCSYTVCKYIFLAGFAGFAHLPPQKNPQTPLLFKIFHWSAPTAKRGLRNFHSVIQKDQTQSRIGFVLFCFFFINQMLL